MLIRHAVPHRPWSGLPRVGRPTAVAAIVLLVMIGSVLVGGRLVFGNAKDEAVTTADAVVVLGGERDGRERYGLEVAREVSAKAVLLSDPYGDGDRIMDSLCGRRVDGIEVICEVPDPPTTRGEAMMARRLADERHWDRVVVVSWQYHLVRARYVFEQCYGPSSDVAMRAVSRSYHLSMAEWTYVYAYQFAALAKAYVEGPCPNA